MKLPRIPIAQLKAKAWSSIHDRYEVLVETWREIFFGIWNKQPVFYHHEVKIDEIRFQDRMGIEYRCQCSCGESKVFKYR